MSYAIYALNYTQQELHHEFTSHKKNPVHVWGDVVAFITDYCKGIKTDLVNDVAEMQAVQDDLHAFVLAELPKWTLVTLAIMDKDTEERLDSMFYFLDHYQEYCAAFESRENRDTLVLLSRLEFGVRRLINQRFDKGWLEGTPEEQEKRQAEFTYYYNHVSTFMALLRYDMDIVKFNQFAQAWSGRQSIVNDPVNGVESIPEGQYIWWTNQGDCEGTIMYHDRARLEGMIPWGGPLPDRVYSELRSRHGRHAAGCVWGLKEQPAFDLSNDFHRYIVKYCGGVLIDHNDLMAVRHNQGFVTDLNLKPLWELK